MRAGWREIYPVTLLALGLGAIGVAYAVFNRGSGVLLDWYALKEAHLFNLGGSFVAQLTVMTEWLPTASLNQPWNSPAWSISCKFFFYLLFPLLIVKMRKLSPARVAVLLAAAFAAQCLIIWVPASSRRQGRRDFLSRSFL